MRVATKLGGGGELFERHFDVWRARKIELSHANAAKQQPFFAGKPKLTVNYAKLNY